MDECEFRARMAALDAVLARHLGPAPSIHSALDAGYVMMALWLPGGAGTGAMNVRAERRKLEKVKELAKRMSDAWQSIHDDITTQMHLMGMMLRETPNGGSSRDGYEISILGYLPELIEMTLPAAEQVMANAPNAGRRNLVNVALVGRLRDVWRQRRGMEPPASMSEAGEFSSYMIDACDALGLDGSPRAAIDSWNAFRVAAEKTA